MAENEPAPAVVAGGDCPRLDVGPTITAALDAMAHVTRASVIEITDPATGLGVPAIAGPTGIQIVQAPAFDTWREEPVALTGVAQLSRLSSLIAHANRFKLHNSALFAFEDPKAPTLSVVVDYHDREAPAWGKHVGRYAFPLDPGWVAWNAIDGQWLDVSECAQFVEDHWTDIAQLEEGEPIDETTGRLMGAAGYSNVAGPSRMLELSRGFAVHEYSSVADIRRLATGEAQIIFKSEHVDEVGAPLKIPTLFVLALPVFRHGAFERLAVRFRYRKQSGLQLRFDLYRPDIVFDRAFGGAVDRAAHDTDLPVFYGKPEAA